MCPYLSDIISQGNAGNLVSGSDEESYYNATIAGLRTRATNSCIDRAAEVGNILGTVILFDGEADESCVDATADELPYLIPSQCVVDGCNGEIPLPGTGGLPPDTSTSSADSTSGIDTTAGTDTTGSDDGGMHVYGLDSWAEVIRTTSANTYQIDEDFVGDVLADLTVLSDDNIGVGSGLSALSHRGFEFETVGEGSIADALDFEQGDMIWELNGNTMQTIDDVTEAFEALQLETVFVVKLDRGSLTITKTITMRDLNSYP